MLAACLIVGLLALLPMLNSNDKAAAPALATTSASPSASGAIGVPVAEAQPDFDNELAIKIKRTYPKYYQCGLYPEDAKLTRGALRPTINVGADIRFDATSKQFVVKSTTPGVTVTSAITRHANTEGGGTYRVQTLTVTFSADVEYFRTLKTTDSADGQLIWASVPALWNPSHHKGYQLYALPDDATSGASYWVMGTKPGCEYDMMTSLLWRGIIAAGLDLPEYYLSSQRP